MTRRSFFIDVKSDLFNLELPLDISHHVAKVLRLKKGDTIELTFQDGSRWKAEIKKIVNKKVKVSLLERLDSVGESFINITLLTGLPKGDKLDLAIRQATELGVKGIIVFPSARSQYRLSSDKVQSKLSRWRKISKEAVCQCGRTDVPHLIYLNSLEEAFEALRNDSDSLAVVASEVFSPEVRDFWDIYLEKPCVTNIIVAVGPEGGWSSEELDTFKGNGWTLVSLGSRILRYETAVVTMISLCQFLWGDMKREGK